MSERHLLDVTGLVFGDLSLHNLGVREGDPHTLVVRDVDCGKLLEGETFHP